MQVLITLVHTRYHIFIHTLNHYKQQYERFILQEKAIIRGDWTNKKVFSGGCFVAASFIRANTGCTGYKTLI